MQWLIIGLFLFAFMFYFYGLYLFCKEMEKINKSLKEFNDEWNKKYLPKGNKK